MSLHTSPRLLRAATTFIRHCRSPSTPQPEMLLAGNASVWAEALKVIRADGDRAAQSSVSGRKVEAWPVPSSCKSHSKYGECGEAPGDGGESGLALASVCSRPAAAGMQRGTCLWAAAMDSPAGPEGLALP